MIKRLRARFVAVAMCSVTAVLLLLLSAINIANYRRIDATADGLLQMLADNGGVFPMPGGPHEAGPRELRGPETPYETRYFTVLLDPAGAVLDADVRSVAAVTRDEAVEYATGAWAGGKSGGYKAAYKYLAVPAEKGGTLYVFLDCSRDLATFRSFLMTSVLVAAAGIAGVFALVLVFSKTAVRPIVESYEKQKRFITDASHELKTPLTVIDASAEVLELSGGENRWTQSIKNQVKRLSDLTAGLVDLARMDEAGTALAMAEFSLSDAVLDSVGPFLALAAAQGRAFALDVQENVALRGNEAAIRQLVSILADNALRHGSGEGPVRVALKKQGKHSELSFQNPVDAIETGDQTMLFERFYRRDASRSTQTGGYGIGLSIAQAIVAAHKGKIIAKSPDGRSLLISIQL